MPVAAMQRAEGRGEIVVRQTAGVTRLERLYQEGCAKLRSPNGHGADGLEAVLINSSGGLTGGDRMHWRAEAGEGGRLTLTTQACEKVYRASEGVAEVATRLHIGAGARIDWLPQETILYDRAALSRALEVEIGAGGTLLAAEAVLLGRRAMGETVQSASLHDRWRIRREGRLIFADDTRLEGLVTALAAKAATLDGASAYASVLLVSSEADRLIEPVRATLDGVSGAQGGASAFDGKLFCRIVAQDGMALRRALIPVLTALRGGLDLPRIWTI